MTAEIIETLLRELFNRVFEGSSREYRGIVMLLDGPIGFRARGSLGLSSEEKEIYSRVTFSVGCGCPGAAFETKRHNQTSVNCDQGYETWAESQGVDHSFAECLCKAGIKSMAAYPFLNKDDGVCCIISIESSLQLRNSKLVEKADDIISLGYPMCEFIPEIEDEINLINGSKRRFW